MSRTRSRAEVAAPRRAIGIALVASGSLAVAMGIGTAEVQAEPTQQPISLQPSFEQEPPVQEAEQMRSLANVEGSFTWNQEANSTNEQLARTLYGATDVLCSARDQTGLHAEQAGEHVLEISQIHIGGDVANEQYAQVEELERSAPVKTTMGCTCSGNPADGRASANAAIEGFELRALIEAAWPDEGANTITFVCADGYEVRLPLMYVCQHYSVMVSSINGKPCAEAIGCANQLWMGLSAARSFARNVVEIRISTEDRPPEVPGGSEGINQPNVGVVEGTGSA